MQIIDPNTQATIDGFTNSSMFKGMFESIDTSRMKAQVVPEIVEDLKKHGVVKAVITGRDCESTYDAASNNVGGMECVHDYPGIFLVEHAVLHQLQDRLAEDVLVHEPGQLLMLAVHVQHGPVLVGDGDGFPEGIQEVVEMVPQCFRGQEGVGPG